MKNRLIIISAVIFVTAEIALSIGLQTTRGDTSAALSYSAIAISCLFCLFLFTKTVDYVCTQLGLVLTLFADYFLVLAERQEQIPAMICFSLTQIFYFIRLYNSHESHVSRRVHLLVRVALIAMALLLTVAVLGEGADTLSLVSLFYYANLIMNLIVAFTQTRRSILLPVELALFLLCDTVVGLNVMAESYIQSFDNTALHRLLNPGFNLAWVFYVPSQVLIPLSLIELRSERKTAP